MTRDDRPVRVLVVEDEPLIAMVVEDVLEALGCEVVGPIAELDEALDAAGRGDFDCAILDVNIRGGLSFPVATMLVERGFPILLATGYRSGSMPDGLDHEGCLAKPFSSAQLEREIQMLCDRLAQ
ncbi:MAG TPA: response regulator [Sphingomicrobium sp.]|nr:response regulator [Sphingomicrobium sp.]